MGHQQNPLPLRQLRDQCKRVRRLLHAVPPPREMRIERRHIHRLPHIDKLRGFATAAPLACPDRVEADALRAHRRADPACLSAATVIEIALRGAIVQREGRRVARSRGEGMTHEGYHAGLFEKRHVLRHRPKGQQAGQKNPKKPHVFPLAVFGQRVARYSVVSTISRSRSAAPRAWLSASWYSAL